MNNNEIIKCNKLYCEWNKNKKCMNENEYLACILKEKFFSNRLKNIKQQRSDI